MIYVLVGFHWPIRLITAQIASIIAKAESIVDHLVDFEQVYSSVDSSVPLKNLLNSWIIPSSFMAGNYLIMINLRDADFYWIELYVLLIIIIAFIFTTKLFDALFVTEVTDCFVIRHLGYAESFSYEYLGIVEEIIIIIIAKQSLSCSNDFGRFVMKYFKLFVNYSTALYIVVISAQEVVGGPSKLASYCLLYQEIKDASIIVRLTSKDCSEYSHYFV